MYFYIPTIEECEAIKSRIVKLSAVNIKPIPGIAYEDNLKRVEAGIDKAAAIGADIICFAETINDRGTTLVWTDKFEPIDGTFCTFIKKG